MRSREVFGLSAFVFCYTINSCHLKSYHLNNGRPLGLKYG